MMFDILIIYCYIIDVDKLYLTQGGLKLRDKALIKYILEHVGWGHKSLAYRLIQDFGLKLPASLHTKS